MDTSQAIFEDHYSWFLPSGEVVQVLMMGLAMRPGIDDGLGTRPGIDDGAGYETRY